MKNAANSESYLQYRRVAQGLVRRQMLQVQTLQQPVQFHAVQAHNRLPAVARPLEAVPLQPLLHSMDSCRTLAAVNKEAQTRGLTAEVLLEVNCSGDPEKHGITPEQLPQDIEDISAFSHVKVLGLMTMAAREGGREAARQNFAQLRELRGHVARIASEGSSLQELSMGMSGDFEEAIPAALDEHAGEATFP